MTSLEAMAGYLTRTTGQPVAIELICGVTMCLRLHRSIVMETRI